MRLGLAPARAAVAVVVAVPAAGAIAAPLTVTATVQPDTLLFGDRSSTSSL